MSGGNSYQVASPAAGRRRRLSAAGLQVVAAALAGMGRDVVAGPGPGAWLVLMAGTVAVTAIALLVWVARPVGPPPDHG